jgi:hypothetical protein
MSKFEDEYKNVKDKNLKLICDYLLGREDMQEKLNNPNKSIEKMFSYVRSKAKKKAVNGCAVISDTEVFGWAVHYYDEEVVCDNAEQPERMTLQYAKDIVKKSVEKKKKPKKEESEWQQETLF